MKKINLILAASFCLLASRSFAQTSTEKDYYDKTVKSSGGSGIRADSSKTALFSDAKNPVKLSDDEIVKLSKRYIPSIIANTGMAPANFDNIGVTFGDDKFNFTKSINDNFGFKLGADAANKSYTLFKPGQSSYVFTGELKGTKNLRGAKWALLDSKGNPTGQTSSTREDWINFSGAFSYSSLPVFSTDTTYVKKHEPAFEFLVSINSVFNSLFIDRYKNKRYLASLGIGIAKINNYKKLSELTYRPGNYYATTKAFVENDDPVVGRKGDFKSFVGAIVRASVFKPLLDPFSLSNLSLGVTANSAGMFSSNHMLNGNAGIYYSKRHWGIDASEPSTLICPDGDPKNCKVSTPKKLIEDFSIGLIFDWKNLQDRNIQDYSSKNFKVLLSAQIPLNFDK
jgi:hypothetical protein